MALEPVRGTQLIDVSQLNDAVRKAVDLADARFLPQDPIPVIISRWDWIGYRLRKAQIKDLNVAQEFAANVAKNVSANGFKADPVVAIVGGDITIGFIERINVPQQRFIR